MEFSMKDMYRASIEHATGGRNTVMYDDYGYPNVMVCIPRFDVSILGEDEFGTGVHPAFNIDGKIVNEIWVGKYQASDMGGVPVSLKGKVAINGIPVNGFTDRVNSVRKKGKGWHMMTNSEWAATTLPAWKRGIHAHASLDATTGRDTRYPKETGGETFGPVIFESYSGVNSMPILTGTGPDTYAHDGTPFGVFDLYGNYWEHVTGLNIHMGSGNIVWTCDADGAPCNSPFIEDIELKGFVFSTSAERKDGRKEYAKGYVSPSVHFVDVDNKSWRLTTSGESKSFPGAIATCHDTYDIPIEDSIKSNLPILKQLCIVTSMGYNKGVFGHVGRNPSEYRIVARGGRNGDDGIKTVNPFAFDMWHYNDAIENCSPERINPFYSFRVCYVSV